MAIPAQHPEPADAAARRAVEPVTVYTVDKLPACDRTFYETVRGGMTLVDELTLPPRDGRAFEVPAGHLFRIVNTEGPQVGDLNCGTRTTSRSGSTAARHAPCTPPTSAPATGCGAPFPTCAPWPPSPTTPWTGTASTRTGPAFMT